MVRPKKKRYFNGVELVDNLYPDPKKRAGKWTYILPDNSKRIFSADTTQEANEIAAQANEKREDYKPKQVVKKNLTLIGALIEDYIEHRQRDDETLKAKRSWTNRAYALRQFGRDFTMPPSRLKRENIAGWWDTLTHSQQKLRHTELRRMFNYLMGRGLFKQFDYNPFTTADDRPRLYLKAKPPRSRLRLSLSEYWEIHKAAGELGYHGLQIAMGLSLLTFMREGDILKLRFDTNIQDNLLKTVIGKSEAQKGHAKAVRLQWDLNEYPALKELINRARELSIKNMRSPFIVSHIIPKGRHNYRQRVKLTKGQLTKERLTEQFRKARTLTGLWQNIPDGKTPPSFHEVRSLADAMAARAGYKTSDIQAAMAHSDESMTLMYLSEHELPHEEVQIKFDDEILKIF